MASLRGRGIPLRVGLVAATLVLVACGLLASGISVTSILRHSLIDRIDQTLLDASRSWAQAPRRMPTPPIEGPNPARPPSDFYVRGIDPDGRIWMAVNDRAAEPALPRGNDVGPVPVTVGSIDNSSVKWRAMTVRGPRGELTTVAIDLSDVQSTVRALVYVTARHRLPVLLVLGVAGYWVVHRSLRPLVQVEKTAATIAAGQLDRRVPERDPRTEVGRLSLALNGMLAQIQRAVASSDSVGRGGPHLRGPDAPVHHRRQPRTAHPADDDPWIRRTVPARRGPRRRDADEPHRERVATDGPARRGPAAAGPPRQQRPLERHRVDLLALASDAVHDAQSIAPPNRKITMEVFDGPGTPEVLGDEARLRQVLGNLVANALQHTPDTAGITVRVGTESANAVLEVCRRGARHEHGRRPPGVRAVLPRRLVARPDQRRHRPGPVDRRLAGACARRHGQRRDRARPGLPVQGEPAAHRRRAGARTSHR